MAMDKKDVETDFSPDEINNTSKETKKPEKEKPKRGNPYEVVQIYDTSCNKIRQARNFEILSFEEYDENGSICMRKSVQFIVIGQNRTWKMFVPYDDFKKYNPNVELPGD